MKIKLAGKKREFQPDRILWKHQSSLDSQFGLWKAGNTEVFVKRLKGEPPGWSLLKKLKGWDLPHTPPLLGLHEENNHYFAFWKHLEGDTLANILQSRKGAEYFREPGLDSHDRLQIIFEIFGLLKFLNQKGFWYPDLDWKNIFIHKRSEGFEVCLIDLDSAAAHSYPYSPDGVSQKLWEGMAKTCKKARKPLINRNDKGSPRVAVHGESMNQSMVLLLAYSLIRLGMVPPDLPLYDPLVNPRQQQGEAILGFHEKLLERPQKWPLVETLLTRYLSKQIEETGLGINSYTTSPRSGPGRFLRALFGR